MVSDSESLQRYARAAGVAMLLGIIFGALGEAYLPGRIVVSGDPAATAANLLGLLVPAMSSGLMLIPMALAGIPLTFWLLIKGVRMPAPAMQVRL